MAIKNINKTVFFSYEVKAEYILNIMQSKEEFYCLFLVIDKMSKRNNKNYMLKDYLERIYYMQYIFDTNILKKDEKVSSIDKLTNEILNYIVSKKKDDLKKELFEKFNILFDDLKFVNSNNDIYVHMNNSDIIKLNWYSGAILVNYYKTLLLEKKCSAYIIDVLGDIIERRY